MKQTELFAEKKAEAASDLERVVLYAFADFQRRGKALAERELPLDRLRGALRRAAEVFGVAELSDEDAATTIQTLGGRVRRVPPYVAKHPFRIAIPTELAERARELYRVRNTSETDRTDNSPSS